MFNVFVAAALPEPVEIYGAPRCAPAYRRATASPARSEKARSARALLQPWACSVSPSSAKPGQPAAITNPALPARCPASDPGLNAC